MTIAKFATVKCVWLFPIRKQPDMYATTFRQEVIAGSLPICIGSRQAMIPDGIEPPHTVLHTAALPTEL